MASPKIGDQNIEFGSQKDGLNIHTHTHTVYSVYSEQTGEEKKKKIVTQIDDLGNFSR